MIKASETTTWRYIMPPKKLFPIFQETHLYSIKCQTTGDMLQIPGESFWQTAPGGSGKAFIPQKFNIDILPKKWPCLKPESPFSKAHHFGIFWLLVFGGCSVVFFVIFFWMPRHMVPHLAIPKLMLLSYPRRHPLHPPRGKQQPVTSHGGLEKTHHGEKKGTQLGLENAMQGIFLVAQSYCFLLREFLFKHQTKKRTNFDRLFYNERVAFPLLFESLHVFQAKSCFISCAVA